MPLSRLAGVLVAAGVVSACSAIIGTRDLTLQVDDSGGDAATSDGGAGSDTGGSNGHDSATDGPAATTDSGTCTGPLTSDPNHCGTCGHSCLGGACTNSICQPIPLAQGQKHPWGIVIDTKPDGFVYWGNDSDDQDDDSILKVGKDGSGLLELAHTPQGQVSSPRSLALDDTFVYWANGNSDDLDPGRIAKCKIGGCGSNGTLLISNLHEPQSMVIDDSQMYWIEKDGARVARAAKADGTNAATITEGLFAVGPVDYSIASDATYLYFAARNVIGRVAKTTSTTDAGTTFDTIVNGVYTVGVAVDDTNVYWASEDDPGLVQYAPKTGLTNGAVATTLASELPNPHAIAVDDKNVYWVNLGPGTDTYVDGSVMMCPKTGCAANGPIVLASKQQNPKDIAVDDLAVYWTVYGNNSTDGAVMKVAK